MSFKPFIFVSEWPPSNECGNPQSVPFSPSAQPASPGNGNGPCHAPAPAAHDDQAPGLHGHAHTSTISHGHDIRRTGSSSHEH